MNQYVIKRIDSYLTKPDSVLNIHNVNKKAQSNRQLEENNGGGGKI